METDNMEELRKELEKIQFECSDPYADTRTNEDLHSSLLKINNIVDGLLEQKLSKQVTDWDKLRARFFLECVDPIEPPIFGCLMGKLNMAPHDMFEWFKKNILIPKETK